MTTVPIHSFRPTGTAVLFLLGLCSGFTSAGRAASFADLQWGGFISQGYLINSGHNDYLGETSEGTFDFREYAANVSYAAGSFRFGAQAFAHKLGDYGDDEVLLDWATIDWQPSQAFGVRVGRVKTPRGLYNESLDLDALRPFVLLPQGVYDARLRDFNAAFDGALIHGNLSLGRVGSLDYRTYFGDIPIDVSSGASDYFGNGLPVQNLSLGMDSTRGGAVFWNAPIVGLRAGYSYSLFQNLFGRSMITLGPGLSIEAMKRTDAHERHLWSLEYAFRDWLFAAEIGQEHAFFQVGPLGQPAVGYLGSDITAGYLAASRRFRGRFEFGAYYSHSKETTQRFGEAAQFDYPELPQDDLP